MEIFIRKWKLSIEDIIFIILTLYELSPQTCSKFLILEILTSCVMNKKLNYVKVKYKFSCNIHENLIYIKFNRFKNSHAKVAQLYCIM